MYFTSLVAVMKNYNSVYLFSFIIAIIIINSCSPVIIPLKGQYPTSPSEITSTKSIDATWSNITDLFTTAGLTVKNIDKTKGLITSSQTAFIPVYSFEDKDGHLINPQAWVVLPITVANKNEWKPKTIYSRWSIEVAETEKGTTVIKVDPVVICTYWPDMFTSAEIHSKSTGKLEQLLKSQQEK